MRVLRQPAAVCRLPSSCSPSPCAAGGVPCAAALHAAALHVSRFLERQHLHVSWQQRGLRCSVLCCACVQVSGRQGRCSRQRRAPTVAAAACPKSHAAMQAAAPHPPQLRACSSRIQLRPAPGACLPSRAAGDDYGMAMAMRRGPPPPQQQLQHQHQHQPPPMMYGGERPRSPPRGDGSWGGPPPGMAPPLMRGGPPPHQPRGRPRWGGCTEVLAAGAGVPLFY